MPRGISFVAYTTAFFSSSLIFGLNLNLYRTYFFVNCYNFICDFGFMTDILYAFDEHIHKLSWCHLQDCYLVYILTEMAGSTSMVFTRTCDATQLLALMLRNLGLKAIPINGHMSQVTLLFSLFLERDFGVENLDRISFFCSFGSVNDVSNLDYGTF